MGKTANKYERATQIPGKSVELEINLGIKMNDLERESNTAQIQNERRKRYPKKRGLNLVKQGTKQKI